MVIFSAAGEQVFFFDGDLYGVVEGDGESYVSGHCEMAGVEMNADFFRLMEQLSPDAFVYEPTMETFLYAAPLTGVTGPDGQELTTLYLMLEEDRVSVLMYELTDGQRYAYVFYDYGLTEIPEELMP